MFSQISAVRTGVRAHMDATPLGLSCAPRVFTKLLKPVYATLHNLGYLSLGYIVDSYLQGDTSI